MRDFEKNPLGKNERISYDDLYELYITRNLSVKEIMAIINRSQPSVEKCLKHYGIKKDLESTRKNISRGWRGRTDLQKATTYDKRIKTCRERYGVDFVMQNKDILNKALETTNRKYGGNSSLCDPTIRQKGKETCLRKYGVEYYSQTPEFAERVVDTKIERYEENWAQIINEKALDTTERKYGVRINASQLPEIKEKVRNTYMMKYGRVGPNQNYSNEIYEILTHKELLEDFINKSERKTALYLSGQLGITSSTLYKYVRQYGIVNLIDRESSQFEIEITNILKEYDPNCCKTRDIISPYEIDIYSDKYKIGVEFNGNYWHSELFADNNYHRDKSLLALQKGVFIYHIFEYEWMDSLKRPIIQSQLQNLFGKSNNVIYARKCELRCLDNDTTQLFLIENHLQGKDISSVRLGLFYNDELVEVMTFCKPRFNDNYDWELSRLCTKMNTVVIGGASKLFKYFIQNYKGTIISYSNIGKTRGTVYEKLGFKFMYVSIPNYVWWNDRTGDVISRYESKSKKLDKELPDLGYIRIFDSGNCVWTYNPSKENFLE